MRLRWLKFVLLTALLTASACGRQPQGLSESPAQQEEAVLKSVTPVSASAEKRFSAPLTPPVDELPPLPFADRPAHLSSAVQTAARDGSADYSSGGGALDVGTTKLLSGAPGGICWAVYQLPGLPASTQLQKLNVDISGAVFSGDSPGYWIGMADFVNNKWVTLNRAQDDYQRLLSGRDFVSASGNLYVFVLVMDAQSMSVESVTLTYDTVPPSGWAELTLDSSADGGWTPSIVLDYYGSAWLAWSDHVDNTPRYAYGIANADLTLLQSWETGKIDPQPTGKGWYTDITMDPRSNLPVASLNYVDVASGADNSQAGMSMFQIGPQNQHVWLNFKYGKSGALPNMDGAKDTTIDFDPQSNFFGIATWATNANSPSKNANDMYVRYIDMGSLPTSADDVVHSNPNFGADLFYPHLRFSGAEEHTRVGVTGTTIYSNTNPPSQTDPTWEHVTEAQNPGPFGSFAYNKAPTGPRYGLTYSKDVGGNHVLFYNEYSSEGAEADVQEVANIGKLGGSEFIGGTSQLAYNWKGQPLVAYTVRSGGTVDVKLAYKVGGNWVSQKVNASPSLAGDTPQDVQCDLAVEPYDFTDGFPRTDRVFVTWHEISAGAGSVKVAFKAIEPE